MLKEYIQKRLESSVVKYFKKHPEVKLVAVSGSVGKTSTKVAIATVLSEKFRVRLHEGNHNNFLSAPLAILGVEYPENIKSLKQWLAVFRAIKQRINSPTDVDVVVQELGSDRIGEIAHFSTYLKPDIGVVASVAPEHMEFFLNLDNVAREELGVANFSKHAIINKDDIDGKFAVYMTNNNMNTYGTSATAEYNFVAANYTIKNGYVGLFNAPELPDPMPVTINVMGEHMLRPAIAAAAVGAELGMNPSELVRGMAKVRPIPGRMNKLRGAENSTIIDDTYNSSPSAAVSALREIYKISAPQRIVVFGDMNELGATSAEEHKKLGELCDPNSLAWVVTVGPQSMQFLAPAARIRGCQVRSFDNAITAGAFVHAVLEKGSVVLFKGSEGGVYLEEAVKLILHSSEDEKQLVRQSDIWKSRKRKFFSRFS